MADARVVTTGALAAGVAQRDSSSNPMLSEVQRRTNVAASKLTAALTTAHPSALGTMVIATPL